MALLWVLELPTHLCVSTTRQPTAATVLDAENPETLINLETQFKVWSLDHQRQHHRGACQKR